MKSSLIDLDKKSKKKILLNEGIMTTYVKNTFLLWKSLFLLNMKTVSTNFSNFKEDSNNK